MKTKNMNSDFLAVTMKTHQALFVIILVAILPIPVFSDMATATPTEEPPLIQFTDGHLTNLIHVIEYYGVFIVGAKIYLGFENMGGSGTVTISFNTIFGPDRSETYEIENAGRYDLFIHVGLGYAAFYTDELEVSSPNQIGNSKVYIFEETQIISIKEILLIPILPPPEVYYVDHRANGSGNGLNWENALQHVQTALQLAKFYEGSVHEIRVAQGTYQPDSVWSFGLLRNATFQLINGVEVKGGYAGVGSPDPNARDVNLFETILSGDQAGNDVDVNDPYDLLDEPTRSENSYHVVTGSWADQTAVLDGFTVTAGNANESRGGGMYNYSSSPAVTDCTFTGNSAGWGGGMRNYDSSPAVTDCIFSGNSAADYGGGMSNYSSSPTVTGCTLTGNSADWGGGMGNYDSSPTVTGCTFTGNSADNYYGGGMFNFGSSPTVTGCTFTGNSAEWGGGMYNQDNGIPTVTNCMFTGNSAGNGGGMFNFGSSPTVTNCTFSGNLADEYGGGIFDYQNSPMVTNCAFSGNRAVLDGGAMALESATALLTNCTFSSNLARQGGGIQNYESSLTIGNCILWNNNTATDGNEIALTNSSTIDGNYCDVQGGEAKIYIDETSSINWGSGNIDADPLFVDDDTADPNLRDYHLLPGSPCIDAGDNSAVPGGVTTDLDGRVRIVDGDCNDTDVVDMGAHEFGWVYIGDFDGQCDVDLVDFAIFALAWLTETGQPGYNPNCDISIPSDGIINKLDLEIFTDVFPVDRDNGGFI